MRRFFLSLSVVVVIGTALGSAACGHEPKQQAPLPSAQQARTLSAAEAGEILREAARRGEVELITGLLDAASGQPGLVDARDDRGFTPLILAAYHGELGATDVLLRRGADACARDRRGNTALMGAAFKGNDAVIRRLLDEPCAVDEVNGEGRTALMFAALVGRSDVVKLLEERGASRAARDSAGKSADDWAATQGATLASPIAPADTSGTPTTEKPLTP